MVGVLKYLENLQKACQSWEEPPNYNPMLQYEEEEYYDDEEE